MLPGMEIVLMTKLSWKRTRNDPMQSRQLWLMRRDPTKPLFEPERSAYPTWDPKLKTGEYEVRASLVYDLNRYNDPNFEGDQTTMFRKSLPFKVK